MTKEEAIKELNEMKEFGDEEALHGNADNILLNRLKELGESEVVQAYQDAKNRVGFWYA